MSSDIKVSPTMYVIFGCPGSGKRTFAKELEREGYSYISASDLTREFKGLAEPISVDKIQAVVVAKLEEAFSKTGRVILDGPRNVQECQVLDQYLQMRKLSRSVVFVVIRPRDKIAYDWLKHSLRCLSCYTRNPSEVKDKCEHVDASDLTETVSRFNIQMQPVYDYYAKRGLSWINTNGPLDICKERFRQFHQMHSSKKV